MCFFIIFIKGEKKNEKKNKRINWIPHQRKIVIVIRIVLRMFISGVLFIFLKKT